MKKITPIITLLLLLITSHLWAAGSCTQAPSEYSGGFVKVTFVCTGDAANGSIPTLTVDTATMNLILGTHFFYNIKAKPTTGGTAPDAADVQVLMDGVDLLGAKGVNLIHATATQDTMPYSTFMSMYRYPPVTSTITLTVANQATVSANYTLELVFAR